MFKKNKNKLSLLILGILLLVTSFSSVKHVQADNTVPVISPFVATTSPTMGITQRVYGNPLILTGYAAGCAQFGSTGLLGSTGTNCGSGGGGGVTAVTGSGNISSSGGTTPNITLTGLVPITNGGLGNGTFASSTIAVFDGTKFIGFATSSLGFTSTPSAGSSGQVQFASSTPGQFAATSTIFVDPLTGNFAVGTTSTQSIISALGNGTYPILTLHGTACCSNIMEVKNPGGSTVASFDWAGSFSVGTINFMGTSNSLREGSFQNGFSFNTPSGAALLINDNFSISPYNYKIGFSNNSEIDGSSHNFDTFISRFATGTLQVQTSNNNLGTSPTLGNIVVANVGAGSTTPFYPLSVEGISSLGNQAIAGFFKGTTTATSTFAGGMNISSGCYAIGGVCVGTGGGTGTVTSVSGSGGTTGLTLTGGPITTSGTLTLGGTLGVANGGTGSTTLGGILKGAGTSAVSSAVAGTDYQAPITLTTTGTSGAATFTGNVLNVPQYAGTTYAAGTGLTLTGSTFSVNTSQNISTLSNLSTAGVTGNTAVGALYSTATTSLSVSSPLTVTGTLGALVGGTNSTINCQTASGSQAGCLSSTDWTTFNGKQAAGSYLTALTGDLTATGPGSAAATLATVNSNVGSFTNANITVNAKGLITAASNGTSGGSAYPFGLTGNATSTLTQFNGGITAFSTSTIGSGTQTGGLTVSGGATTTLNAYFVSNVGIGTTTPSAALSVQGSSPATTDAPLTAAIYTGNGGVSAGSGKNGGDIVIKTGTGGAGSSGNGGRGGNLTITGGIAGASSAGVDGIGGSVTISGGNALTSNNGTGGAVVLSAGTSASVPGTPTLGSIDLQIGGVDKARLAPSGNFGVATTGPWKTLSVTGDEVLTGGLFDSVSSAGSLNNILTSTGSATKWLSASGLGVASSTDVQIFATAGTFTWTKPANAKTTQVLLIGGGGGGASGAKGASANARCGGGGGAGAGYSFDTLPASLLGSTESVIVAAGGSGGAAQATNSTAGNNGGSITSSSFGNWIRAAGGLPGTGGTIGASSCTGAAGTASSNASFLGGAAGAAGVTAGVGSSGSFGNNLAGGGGASGGGVSSANAAANGGIGGAGANAKTAQNNGGAAGVVSSTSPGNGTAATTNEVAGGGGGGGGAGSTSTTAQTGGNGGVYGGGGGGGGAGVDSTGNSGAGGNGGQGIVIVFTYF